MADLLPCPCCGDPPEERPYEHDIDDYGNKDQMGVVFCRGCGLRMETCCGQAAAVARWNTRAVPVASDRATLVVLETVSYVLKEMYGYNYWTGTDWVPYKDQAEEYQDRAEAELALRNCSAAKRVGVFRRQVLRHADHDYSLVDFAENNRG